MTTTSGSGDSRGWTDPGQLDEHLLEKIDIPDRDINDTVSSQAKKEGDNITTVSFYHVVPLLSFELAVSFTNCRIINKLLRCIEFLTSNNVHSFELVQTNCEVVHSVERFNF
jgi:hypothetical protein